ncbi:MAG: N-acetylglucosamine-6-phosphate deacetylase [Pseudonocardia sp.]|nr:N-acetylglucosamine-6-phosphate deacetylase [Pseudonocardia sp.]
MIRVAAQRLVTPTGVVEPGWLEVQGTRITRVERGPVDPCDGLTVLTVIPGLVDVHVHGGGGTSFADGTDAAVLDAVAHHRRHGTTTVCASLMTASLPALHAQVPHLATLVEAGVLAGVHLEGPWLSPLRAGAHPPALLRAPGPVEVRDLLLAGRGTVREVTLAPELEGGIDAVRAIIDHGAVAALGHTDADYAVAGAALDAGASMGTHLGNGMRPVHHREPGVVLALLERADVVVELINDGVHLHDAVTAALIRAAGRDRVALISDAIPASGLPDGTYHLAGDEVTVRGSEVRRRRTGSLAGSTITLAGSLRRAVIDLGVALPDAVAMASSTPAAALGLPDVGRLEVGAVADIVVLDEDLVVSAVMHRGVWLPR